MMQVPHLVGSVLLSQRKRPSCYRGRRVVFGISNLATLPKRMREQESYRGELHGIIVLDGRSHLMAWN